MYFASPVKWSLQGVWSPYPSSRFTLFPVTSALQEFSLLPQRKNEIVFANRPVFSFDKYPITTSYFLTATANFSSSFSGSNRALRNYPSVGFHFFHISMITFYMGIQFVHFKLDYWQFFFYRGIHV